ncbi:response receiver sensor diguanylate cyclase [Syntrophotalea carbinolica DSM 2380]|uniref:diguanylate cyclase n=1 Tax=Syntrophotalea carbinolica (strain DSM 2380 / NBRC 103641 / GraBd1) TaxID=338963 RepID=Q3A5D1_SYNC1|nr:diguanylate cyclase [Syntrophotalea carbinolica]ABA88426.1 response receiver sensor diguanylate cyclase [Syntrophotalea carbinolica DSM 2380]
MRKVLVIDQQVFSRIKLKDSLSSEYFVLEANNEKEAVGLAKTNPPDLVILDMEMLGENSSSVCRKLKETRETKNIPLILLYTNEQRDDIANGLHSGADDYLTKPFNPNDLLARIEIHLRTRDYYADLRKIDLLMLLELTEIISVTRNPKRILSIIVERMIETIDVSRCSIIGINDFGELLVIASSDLPENKEIKLNLKRYPEIEKALSTQRPIVVQDVKSNPLMKSVRENIKDLPDNSIFVVPIVKKQNVIGTFFLRTASPLKDGITDRIFKLCQIIASISGNALENAMIFESMETNKKLLEELSVRDSLTQLYNHQYYHTRFEEEFSRAQRYDLPLSCIFFDIDDFKKINDRYGHLTGDMVLRQIARLIKKLLRKSDISARYGGEEFAICLPNTGTDSANQFAERLLVLIRELSIQQLKGEHVTVSMGTSTYMNNNVASYRELIQLADKAMYQAKESGKNRICCANILS